MMTDVEPPGAGGGQAGRGAATPPTVAGTRRRRAQVRLGQILQAGFVWSLLGLATSAPAGTTLVPFGAVWKYLDDGSDQGAAWQQPAFDDSLWNSGPAQLGYGDGDEATVVSYGPNPSNKYITTYFRHTFEVTDPGAFASLQLRLLRDDGGVVYLNGVEVFRAGMPAGTISNATLATLAAENTVDTNDLSAHLNLLTPGANVLAVEIHQQTVVSSDLSFDLELTAEGDPDTDGDGMPDAWELAHSLNPNDPGDAALDADADGMNNLDEYRADTDPRNPSSRLVVNLTLMGGNVVLSWLLGPAAVSELAYTDSLEPPVWTVLPGAASPYVAPGGGSRRFYRVGASRSGAPPFAYSANLVGYLNVVLPTGYTSLANPLNNGANAINLVLPSVPDGACVFKEFTNVNCYFDGFGWEEPTMTLPPGAAFFFFNPPGGNLTLTFVGDVTAAPIIWVQPVSQTNAPGGNATFAVAALGQPPLGYQWRHNGATLPGATTATLLLADLQAPHAGAYSVVVSNASGSTTSADAMLTLVECVAPPAGLVGWWPGNGNATDLAGTNHGVVVNGATYAAGRVGQAFSLDGVDDSVRVPHSPSLSLTSSFTCALWVRPNWLANAPVVFEKGTAIGNRLGLQVNADGSVCGYFDSGSCSVTAPAGTVAVSDFTHLTYVLDAAAQQVRLYANGALVASGSEARRPQGNADALWIGNAASQMGYGLSGLIDEFALWQRVLASNEIAALYAASGAGMCAPHAGTPRILVNGVPHTSGSVTAAPPVQVTLQATFPAGALFYSLDGSDPASGLLYTVPFAVTEPAMLRIVAYSATYIQFVEAGPVSIVIAAAPVVTQPPQSRTAALNAVATFSAAAAGPSPLAYQWFFDGAPLFGATNSTLTLNPVSPASAGDYRLVVSNPYGAATSSVATLTVLTPPGFATQPAGTTVPPGSDVTLTVTATGTPPLRYQWRKNGVNIEGATNSSFTGVNVQVPDGGNYTVLVANDAGVAVSAPARLTIEVPSLAPGDLFVERVSLSGDAAGAVHGTSATATREAGEPYHAGKVGGRSVWYAWTAPASGVVRFNTAGSAFDTLLAVYSGSDLPALTLVAADDDRGGFLTSELLFSASYGVTYVIAIDGFGGAGSDFVLSWDLAAAPVALPVITVPPASQTVTNGATVTFTGAAEGAELNHQWTFNGVEIPGATATTYTVPEAGPAHVGAYTVRVRNAAGTVESQPALLEIGAYPELRSTDKLRDLFPLPPNGAFRRTLTAAGTIPVVAAGTLTSQILNTTNSTTSENETNACGVIGGASRWLALVPGANGLMVLDTTGSSFDTALAVFVATVPGDLTSLELLACDDNGAADGIRSRVVYPVLAGQTNYVRVDGKNGASGVVQLFWGLGLPPAAPTSPTLTLPPLRLGETLTLSGPPPEGVPPPAVQWLRNDGLLALATNLLLVLPNLQPGDAGLYAVRLENFIGAVTGLVARVVLETNFVALARSSFDAGAEGWAVWGDADPPAFQTAGGNPGGYISARDRLSGAFWYWRAPAGFLGNKSALYGGLFSFDLKQSEAPETWAEPDVVLMGGGHTLVFDLARIPGVNWTAFKVPLVETAGWRKGTLAGPAPTQAEFLRVLAGLTNVLVRGEFSTAQDIGGLDNVFWLAASASEVVWLHARRRPDGALALEWPTLREGYQLEAASDVTFTNRVGLPAVTDTTAGLHRVIQAASEDREFFRLRKP